MITRRAFIAGGSAAAATLAAPAMGAIADDIAALLDEHQVPGVSFAVVENGKVGWTEAVGQRSLGGQPVATSHLFQAASMSKTINALLILSLVRDGLIDLDTPANTYLSRWKLPGPRADNVTIAHLLSHTGATTVHGFGGYRRGQPLPTLIQILDGVRPANSAAIENTGRPGRAYKYSGGGVTVLQLVAEEVAGASYTEAVETRVLAPLAMSGAIMRVLEAKEVPLIVNGHDSQGQTLGYNNYPEIAAAGLWTTPADLARALIAIMGSWNGDDGSFLPRALARRMLTPVVGDAALGTFVSGKGRFSHGGVNYGFRGTYVANASSRSGYVVMSNGENGDALNAAVIKIIRREMGW